MELGGGEGILENDQIRLMEEYRGSYFLHFSGADKVALSSLAKLWLMLVQHSMDKA